MYSNPNDLFFNMVSSSSNSQSIVKHIPFSDLKGISVGNAQNNEAKTGVTVFYFPYTACAAVKVLGGGPASRETPLLDAERSNTPINALVFGGGSAFGLEASHGVMKCLEEAGIGFDTGFALVPIVCQSDIYDLSYGKADVRPDMAMGYEACENALRASHAESGNVGVGTGATVGKAEGMKQSQKSGIGYAAAQIGDLIVGVAAVVNAYGDIYYHGEKIAGMFDGKRSAFQDVAEALFATQPRNLFTGNTSLVAVFTNGDFDTAALKKIANMSSAGFARAIRPVFTMADGDTIYAVSVGKDKVAANVNVAGTLAADLVEEAMRDAVLSSKIPDEEFLKNIIF